MKSYKISFYVIITFLLIIISDCLYRNPEVISYKDSKFTELFRSVTGWIAGDGDFSVPLPDNRSLWVFGDSYIDCYDPQTGTVPCLFQARNAAVIIENRPPFKLTTMYNKSGTSSFFEYGGDRNYWFWPESGFFHNDTVFIFLARIRSTGQPGMWGFERVDSVYIAKIHLSDLETVYYSTLTSMANIDFGCSVLSDSDGYNYIYGIRSNGFGNDLLLARFKPDSLYIPWQFYDGNDWITDVNRIRKIYDEFTASFSVTKVNDKFILFTTEFSVDCDQGKNIYALSSDSPTGPFTNKHIIWKVDDTLKGHWPFFYAVSAHPEYNNFRKELLITYCINGYGKCIEECVDGRMNPDFYRPRALRLPFKLLN
ncbi:MAG: DUF5005 domain-containing protein [Bacteroidales bacterium]